ncbi:hypothetical protein FRX31_008262, partial [Thalictrum thalictroides]
SNFVVNHISATTSFTKFGNGVVFKRFNSFQFKKYSTTSLALSNSLSYLLWKFQDSGNSPRLCLFLLSSSISIFLNTKKQRMATNTVIASFNSISTLSSSQTIKPQNKNMVFFRPNNSSCKLVTHQRVVFAPKVSKFRRAFIANSDYIEAESQPNTPIK